MKILLSAETDEFLVDIPREYATLIEEQLMRISGSRERRVFIDSMLKHLAGVLSKLLDPDLKPPTEKQIAFAHQLSRIHKVNVPVDALIYKNAMHDFIEKYVSKKRSKNSNR